MSAYPSTTAVLDSLSVAAPASGKKSFVIEKTFDLDALVSAKIANADIVNLFTLPANTMILATGIKATGVAVGCSSTCTAKLRFGTTDIGATADILTANTVAVGGNATVGLPLSVGTSAVLANLVFAIGAGTTTKNPTVRVTIYCLDLS